LRLIVDSTYFVLLTGELQLRYRRSTVFRHQPLPAPPKGGHSPMGRFPHPRPVHVIARALFALPPQSDATAPPAAVEAGGAREGVGRSATRTSVSWAAMWQPGRGVGCPESRAQQWRAVCSANLFDGKALSIVLRERVDKDSSQL
jgi:hypothetical protein